MANTITRVSHRIEVVTLLNRIYMQTHQEGRMNVKKKNYKNAIESFEQVMKTKYVGQERLNFRLRD